MDSRSHILSEMTWPELRAALSTIDLALIPVGATEQHGPAGTFDVDSVRADEFTRRLAARLYPRALAVPTICFGFSPHHMSFPGTITLEAETLMAVVEEIVCSLYRHGIRKFLIINAHGGNRDALSLSTAALVDRYPEIRCAWVQISALVTDIRDVPEHESPLMGHACQRELSQSFYLAPHTFRLEAAEPAELTEQALALSHPAIKVGRNYDELTRNGALGNPTFTSREFGAAMINTALDRLASWLAESY